MRPHYGGPGPIRSYSNPYYGGYEYMPPTAPPGAYPPYPSNAKYPYPYPPTNGGFYDYGN